MIQDMAMEQKRKKEQAKGKAVNYIRWCLNFETKYSTFLFTKKLKRHKSVYFNYREVSRGLTI